MVKRKVIEVASRASSESSRAKTTTTLTTTTVFSNNHNNDDRNETKDDTDRLDLNEFTRLLEKQQPSEQQHSISTAESSSSSSLPVEADTAVATATAMSSPSTTRSSSSSSSLSPLDDTNILQYILSFVGSYQYRFIASINRHFQKAYLQPFCTSSSDNNNNYNNNKNDDMSYVTANQHKTRLNVSTVGHAAIALRELHEHHTHELYLSAARHGNLPVLEYLRSESSDAYMFVAAEHGHINKLPLVPSHNFERDNLIDVAVFHAQLPVLQWLHSLSEDPMLFTDYVCYWATFYGIIPVLKWLHSIGYEGGGIFNYGSD